MICSFISDGYCVVMGNPYKMSGSLIGIHPVILMASNTDSIWEYCQVGDNPDLTTYLI